MTRNKIERLIEQQGWRRSAVNPKLWGKDGEWLWFMNVAARLGLAAEAADAIGDCAKQIF